MALAALNTAAPKNKIKKRKRATLGFHQAKNTATQKETLVIKRAVYTDVSLLGEFDYLSAKRNGPLVIKRGHTTHMLF